MKIQLDGAYNARDLGGIITKFGVVKGGRLFRSDELSRLSDEGKKQFENLGIKRVVDLRTAAEIQSAPDALLNAEYVNIPVIRATTFGITYEKSSGEEIAKMLEAGFKRMEARGETYGEHMSLLYRKFVNDDHSREAYGKFLRLLAEHPVDGGTLWHCTAGKDRCGTCAALLLWCLGADKQAILSDYMLTNEQRRENELSILNKVKGFVSEENIRLIKRMLEADESYLEDFFSEIKTRFASVENFLKECGVSKNHTEMLKKHYLE